MLLCVKIKEESSVNFEQYTTSLNLHLTILEEVKRSKKTGIFRIKNFFTINEQLLKDG